MSQWDSYQKSIIRYPDLGFSIDFSRMNAPDDLESSLEEDIARAFEDLRTIESGGIANPGRTTYGRSLLAAKT